MTEAGIVLIASAAYIDTELAAEFGLMPPSFLPVGHSRLYELQLKSLSRHSGKRVMTLPASFVIPEWDRKALKGLGVELIMVPDGLRLGESVLYALEVLGRCGEPIRILHGDTLIYDLPQDRLDLVASGHADVSYAWGVFNAEQDAFVAVDAMEPASEVIAGFFAFSDDVEFRRALAQSRGDFIGALNLYHRKRPLDRLKVLDWLDFGHLQTFFLSRCNVRTQRAFNDLQISYLSVEKTSLDTAKMEAEAGWFENLPYELRSFTPTYLGRRTIEGQAGYAVEYLPTPSLHELFTYGGLSQKTWSRILESCFGFMQACADRPVPDGTAAVIAALTVEKTMARLIQYEGQGGASLDDPWRYDGRAMPSIRDIAEITACEILKDDRSTMGVMHGDFCFTNIFYDHRRQQIRTIDPRGAVTGAPTIYGDVRYDLAKLNHSVSGYYDLILANRYSCTGFEDRSVVLTFPSETAAAFLPALAADYRLGGRSLADRETLAITIHLFLSMLPLHADRPDRQRAFVANALRLFAEHWEDHP